LICPFVIPFVVDYDETKYATSNPMMNNRRQQDLYHTKLVDFYKAPCVRHAYQVAAYTVLFCLSAITLQFEFTFADYGYLTVQIATIVMTTSLCIDQLKNVRKLNVFSLILLSQINIRFKVNKVVRDLLPFLLIVVIFWSMYTIIFSVIILRPGNSLDASVAFSRLFLIMRSGFFQMFGEFNLEELLQYYGW
uniref:PhoLip_ATPase_C domain-containing protein n=1 Tax=Hydatigena taeniaeformis TaxID=6205 RepID=A0A0R3WUI7_HYDTA